MTDTTAVGDSTVDERPAGDRSARVPGGRRRTVVVTGLLVLLTAWAAIFLVTAHVPRGPIDTGLGGDFATFYSASSLLASGGNPYNQAALYARERALWHEQRLGRPKYESYVRAGNPPLFYWLIGPLTSLTYRQAAWIWIGLCLVALGGGFLLVLAALDWSRQVVPLYAFMCMPQTLLAAYYANVDALVFCGFGAALWLRRRSPIAAGAALGVAWLKPQYGFPLAALVILFLVPKPWRAVAGLALMTAVGATLSLVTTGFASLQNWGSSLAGLSNHANLQPDIVSLPGLYVYSTTVSVQLVLGVALLLVAAVLTLWWWLRSRDSGGELAHSGWLWVVWLLATPLAHFHYEIMLAPAVLAVLGRNAVRLATWTGAALIFVLLISVLLFPTHRGHGDVQSLTLVVVGGVMVYMATGEQRSGRRRAPYRSPCLGPAPGAEGSC
jgi:hypothetical protein